MLIYLFIPANFCSVYFEAELLGPYTLRSFQVFLLNRHFNHVLSLFISSNTSGLKISIALFSYGHSSFLLVSDHMIYRISSFHFQSFSTPQLSLYIECAFGNTQHTDGSWCSASLPFLSFNWSIYSITFNKMN